MNNVQMNFSKKNNRNLIIHSKISPKIATKKKLKKKKIPEHNHYRMKT